MLISSVPMQSSVPLGHHEDKANLTIVFNEIVAYG